LISCDGAGEEEGNFVVALNVPSAGPAVSSKSSGAARLISDDLIQ